MKDGEIEIPNGVHTAILYYDGKSDGGGEAVGPSHAVRVIFGKEKDPIALCQNYLGRRYTLFAICMDEATAESEWGQARKKERDATKQFQDREYCAGAYLATGKPVNDMTTEDLAELYPHFATAPA